MGKDASGERILVEGGEHEASVKSASSEARPEVCRYALPTRTVHW